MRQIIHIFMLTCFVFTANKINASSTTNDTISDRISDNIFSIIPQPVSLDMQNGYFNINNKTVIIAYPNDNEIMRLVDLLNSTVETSAGYKLNVKTSETDYISDTNSIFICVNNQIKLPNAEAYKLYISEKQVIITSIEAKGAFYGLQTLFQLFPIDKGDNKKVNNLNIPCCNIYDYPQFQYRGMHLDVCRHFFSISFVKKFIDVMAQYKFNNFHWHLTEDQGWRIEIKKYPKLTQIGSKRRSTTIGRNEGQDNKLYGGFYTQKEAREIVKYAADRFINVIPEIELPGHAMAAIAAYPELSCSQQPTQVMTTWGVSDTIYCAGNENTFTFLEDVLTEIIDIFPSKLIHIGGDEAPKKEWQKCKKCQKRIKDNNLKDENELQSYFIKRIEKFLNKKGRKIIGWDEILEGGLAPEATVMSWRGIDGGIEAAKEKHNVIMTPTSYCYFDYYQGDPNDEPLAFGNKIDLETVYKFNPIPKDIDNEDSKYIIGGQANLWTEYITTEKQLEYMAFPRALAMAEALWTSQEAKNFNKFSNRLNNHFVRLKQKNINFSLSSLAVKISTITNNNEIGKLKIDLYSPTKDENNIKYSLGNNKKLIWKNYTHPFYLDKTSQVNAQITESKYSLSKNTLRTVYIHAALGVEPRLNTLYSSRYEANGATTLTNGLKGNKSNFHQDWLGFHGNDIEVIIDLKQPIDIKTVNIGFLSDEGNWIFVPTKVEILTSNDNINFTPLKANYPELKRSETINNLDYKITNIKSKARYVKVVAKNRGICPDNHVGKGEKAWLFVDEIMINQK